MSDPDWLLHFLWKDKLEPTTYRLRDIGTRSLRLSRQLERRPGETALMHERRMRLREEARQRKLAKDKPERAKNKARRKARRKGRP